ncbi:type II toxin-antitoxin system RelE/ParE family toxin [Cupriavidus necator]|uniref:type II toxin-antitoxin system RelE/ParE family toxin n=1 Tax=Cupriavidus necator TaxID=106590 RepID=UPI0027873D74|nr:type II toxin-antitoxin system RelE/ParE family toxin [Cupriavidus necator]MDQ0142287.1 proteic killer suppression protein [Cupriavidus necator]
MIQSFRCSDTFELFAGRRVPRFASIRAAAVRKLVMLHEATTLDMLRSPPGNRLERPSGERKGRYSIRINNPCRICFVWTHDGPAAVEIIDHH